MTERLITFERACAMYPFRFTADHVPDWAMRQRSNGSYYAPSYASDREWYDLAKFPGEEGWIGIDGDCYSGPPTWPFGKALAECYTPGVEPIPFTSTSKRKPTCRYCGSEDVQTDARGVWSVDADEWELHSTYDYTVCPDCDAEGNDVIEWVEV